MKGFLIACSLFVLCYAADRPAIPGTFAARTKFEVHRGQEAEFGVGYWSSDSMSKKTVRNDTLEKEGSGYFYDLELFEQHMDFHIRPDGRREECSHGPLRGDFVSPFEWVKEAKYNGSETIEHHTLDVWYFRAASTEFAVGVEPNAPNVPVLFMDRTHGMEMFVEFTTFDTKTPPASDFEIPRQCRDPPPRD